MPEIVQAGDLTLSIEPARPHRRVKPERAAAPIEISGVMLAHRQHRLTMQEYRKVRRQRWLVDYIDQLLELGFSSTAASIMLAAHLQKQR